MKNLKFILLVSILFFTGQTIHSQACQASFSYVAGTLPGEIIVTDNSTGYPVSPLGNNGNLTSINTPGPYNSGPNYANGNISTAGGSDNLIFSYNGTYVVYYQLSGSTCSSIFTDTIVISTIPTNIPCSAGLTITPGPTQGSITYTDNSIGEDISTLYDYSWASSILANFTQANQTVNIQYNANGVYPYSYFIVDTITGCYDSITGTININSFPCQAGIWVAPTGPSYLGQFVFGNTSTYCHINTLLTPGASILSQTVGPNQNFSIVTYPANGTYPYTLIIQDTISGCTDTLMGTTVISNMPVPCTTSAGLTITPGTSNGQYIFTDNSTNSVYGNLSIYGAIQSNYQLTSATPSISHTFASNGGYPYMYSVYDNGTCSDTIFDTLWVNTIPPCNVQALITVSNGSNPGEFIFTNNSTNANAGAFIQLTGSPTVQVLTPTTTSVTYSANGTYSYAYVAIDTNTNCDDTVQGVLTVTGLPSPCSTLAALSITPGSNPGEFIFTDNSTNANLGAFLSLSGSPTVQTLSSNPFSALVTYSANGTYTYSYAALDTNTNCGDSLIGTVTVTGINTPCNTTAGLTIVPTGSWGQYTFTDNSTNSNYGNLSIYGSSAANYQLTSTNPSVTHTFPTNGTYYYIYSVYDNGTCSDTLYDSLIVSNTTPCSSVAGLTINPTSTPGQFNVSDNSTGMNYSEFYSGTGSSTVQILPSTSPVTVTYPANGTYTYTYFAMDTVTGCSDTLFGTVVVTGITTSTPCSASFILLQDSLNQSQYYCWNTATNSTGGTSGLTYFWDFGDGNTSTLAYPIHTYNSLGSYVLCLTISDSTGCTSSYCDTVTVTVKATGTTINVLPPDANLALEDISIFDGVSLFPNPSNGNFTIELNTKSSSSVEIITLDISGKVLQSSINQVHEGINKIEMHQDHLAKGVYLIRLVDHSGNNETIRWIKK